MKRKTYETMRAEEGVAAHVQAMLLRLIRSKELSEAALAAHAGLSRRNFYRSLCGEGDITVRQMALLFDYAGEKLRITCDGIDRLDEVARQKNEQGGARAANGP